MEDRTEALRLALEKSREGQSRWRCPASLREEVMAYAREQIEQKSQPRYVVARELGLSDSGLSRWLRPSQTSAGSFRAVSVIADRSGEPDLTLVTPRGYRIEGLSVASAAALLRQL